MTDISNCRSFIKMPINYLAFQGLKATRYVLQPVQKFAEVWLVLKKTHLLDNGLGTQLRFPTVLGY